MADIEQGIVTLAFGLLSFGLMPAGPTQTASWFRGKKGWFTARYVPASLLRQLPTARYSAAREGFLELALDDALRTCADNYKGRRSFS